MADRLEEVRKKLEAAYERARDEGGWRRVGMEFGVSGGMAFRVARQGYVPRDEDIRRRLGLELPQVECWADLPVGRVKWAIENREEF
jgi:hypothetical protein